jgi:hypothetical protein
MLFFNGIQTTTPLMKQLLLNLALTILSLLLASCVTTQKIDPEQELIRNYMPCPEEDCLTYGRYGEYSYNLYAHGVEIQALSPEVAVHYAKIWDTDHDGTLESVWIVDHGKLRYSSQINHPILINDPDPMILTGFIGLGNHIRQIEQKKKNGVRLAVFP